MHLSAFAHDRKEIKEISGCPTKKRKIQQTAYCITKLFAKDDQLHAKMNENLFAPKAILSVSDGLPKAPKAILNVSDGLPKTVLSHNCEISNILDERILLNEKDDGVHNPNYKHGRKITADEQQNQHQTDIFRIEGKPNNSMVGNVDTNKKESNTAVSRDWDTLICIQDMVSVDCLKLLELDNKDDEGRYRIAMQMPLSPTLPEINFTESEKGYLPSFHSFDVIDLEIKSNKVKLKTSNNKELFSVSNKYFTHSHEEPNSSVGTTTYDESNKNEIGRDFSIGNSRLNVERMCDVRGSDAFMNSDDLVPSIFDLKGPLGQATPLVKCLLDQNNIPNSNSCDDIAYSKNNRYLPGFPNCTARSHQSCEHDHTQSFNMESHSYSVAMGPETTFGIRQVQSSGLVKHHNEGEGKEDGETIVTKSLNHDLPDTGRRNLIDNGNTIFAAGQAIQTTSHMVLDSSSITEATKEEIPLPAMKRLEDPHKSDKSFEYCILFSSTKDENSISRIVRARNTLAQGSLAHADCFEEVFHALKFKSDLQPEEKASVFFSLLLCNFSGDILCCLDSVAVKLHKVIFERETKWLFQEIFHGNILLKLIEDFLISGKFLVYDAVQFGSSSSNLCCLEGENIWFFYEAATLDQLITGAAVLACICVAVGHIDFLLEASYKILRMCRSNTSLILSVLHKFASVAGKKFFSTKKYSFVVPAIRSLVSLLEKGHDPLSDASPIHPTCHKSPIFPPCKQCPFYANAVSLDQYASSLLDMLQDYASGRQSNMSTSTVSSAYTALAFVERDEESLHSKTEIHDLNIHCDESCVLSKYSETATNQSDCILEMSFCHFTDVVSLLELVGCYASWEWKCTNVIPRLLKILEMCVAEEISADLLVLIGLLARFGIDAGGYQQSGIAELRCTLSSILETFITNNGSFIVQLAVVDALINLLPLRFKEVVDEDADHSLDASQSSHAKVITKWFSQLSRELKHLSLSLFCHSDEQKI